MLAAEIFVDATTLKFLLIVSTLPELTTFNGTGHGDTAATDTATTLFMEMMANIKTIARNQNRWEKLRSIELQNVNNSTV